MSKQTEEQSSNFFIFDTREIFPLGFTKDLAQFEQTDESDAYHFTTASEKIKYLSTFHGMNIGGYERLGEDDDRFQYDKKGNVKGIDGFGSDRMTRLKT